MVLPHCRRPDTGLVRATLSKVPLQPTTVASLSTILEEWTRPPNGIIVLNLGYIRHTIAMIGTHAQLKRIARRF